MNDVARYRRDLLRRLADGDETVRADLVESFTPYIATIARNAVRTRFPDHLDDVVSEARLELFKVVQRFDPTRCKDPLGALTASISYGVRSAIRVYIAKNCAYTIGVSEFTQQRIAEVARVRSALRQELGQEPTVEQVAAQTDYTPASVERYLTKLREGHTDFETFVDWIGLGHWNSPERQVLHSEKHEATHAVADKVLKICNSNERAIVVRSFGLDGEDPASSVQQTSNPTAARTVRKRQKAALDRAGRLLRIAATC